MKRIQYNGNRLVFRIAPLVCLEGRCAFSADGAPVAITVAAGLDREKTSLTAVHEAFHAILPKAREKTILRLEAAMRLIDTVSPATVCGVLLAANQPCSIKAGKFVAKICLTAQKEWDKLHGEERK